MRSPTRSRADERIARTSLLLESLSPRVRRRPSPPWWSARRPLERVSSSTRRIESRWTSRGTRSAATARRRCAGAFAGTEDSPRRGFAGARFLDFTAATALCGFRGSAPAINPLLRSPTSARDTRSTDHGHRGCGRARCIPTGNREGACPSRRVNASRPRRRRPMNDSTPVRVPKLGPILVTQPVFRLERDSVGDAASPPETRPRTPTRLRVSRECPATPTDRFLAFPHIVSDTSRRPRAWTPPISNP